jgi:hypothetical protein
LHLSVRAFFSLGEYLMTDPGYICRDEPNLQVPPLSADCQNDPAKAIVSDIHRRHRFLVEYSIGATKRNWPVRI